MTVKEFFQKNAADFAARDMEACADTLAIPSTIHVGDRQIHIGSRPLLLDMLTAYRRNLDVEAYSRTELEMHHVMTDRHDRWQAFLTWRHLNDQGAVISAVDATYIVRETSPGRLQCITAEIISPAKSRLLMGLPVV
ncbi:hypothetical protein KUL25_01900 [Rhodobacteraceae bacterium N5(2021)]|uniref:SnoaL-like protein n=1 Tax=Gymnodinialimonas phycosphaerae TaxID=2841589 RepID=A0A975TVH9_9RHOB|nr:hypothetical protein [Gymnodinialimonas phycosphaerae]MBY4891514.1 hypothetical protein [Gymnodinialimonas phycosphaerae]